MMNLRVKIRKVYVVVFIGIVAGGSYNLAYI